MFHSLPLLPAAKGPVLVQQRSPAEDAAHSTVAVADTGVYLAVERLDAEDGSTSADTAEDASEDAAVGRIGTAGCGASYAAVVQYCE